MIGIVIACVIIAVAAYILIKRAVCLIRTKGTSACENCPYSGVCKKQK